MFRFIVKNIFKKNNQIMLGRWGNNLNDKQKNINSIWANSDHCGDIICGKPENIKSIIRKINDDKELKHTKNNKSK